MTVIEYRSGRGNLAARVEPDHGQHVVLVPAARFATVEEARDFAQNYLTRKREQAMAREAERKVEELEQGVGA